MNISRTITGTTPVTMQAAQGVQAAQRPAGASKQLSSRLSALALAGLLTSATLLGVNTLASVDGAPAALARAAQHHA